MSESQPVEQVFVVPRDILFQGLDTPHGFGTEQLHDLVARIRDHGGFAPRPDVEEDPSRKQIIPYVLITHGHNVFLLRRREAQTEARLRNLFSVGVGGHINPVDESVGDPVAEGLRRELDEEVDFGEEPAIAPLGWINDDTNAVGSVHFGLVFHARLERGLVAVAEKDMMEGRFVPLAEAFDKMSEMETWSQLLMAALKEKPALAFS